MKDINCDKIMSTKVLTLHPKDTIENAVDIFKRYNIHHIPICINERIVGMLSLGDILAAKRSANSHEDKVPNGANTSFDFVESLMTHNPICLYTYSKVSECLKLMKINRINCIPIINKDKITGIITSYDIIALLEEEIRS